MRVIICGLGQVGKSLAEYLSGENNDVTVIDSSSALVAEVQNELDLKAIIGHASDPEILKKAGAGDADLLIAVTDSDEVNMVACQVGHSLFGVPKKIARIRNQCYLDPSWSNLFSRSHMPIDVIVSPEVLVAKEIYQRLSVPGTTTVIKLGEGKAHLIGLVCLEDCPLLNTNLGQLGNLFPDISFRVLSIFRNNRTILPDENDMLQVGDEAYVVLDSRHLRRVMAAFGHLEKEARKIIISGGGNIGLSLVKFLKTHVYGLDIRIIERRAERARYLSEELENVIVLLGDTLDRDILEEASIETSEALVALMNDDESNILGSLLAKQYGCSRVITLVNNNAYYPLVGPLGIDVMVSPKSIIVANIMQHVRRGRIKGLHTLRDGSLEVIEAEISDSSAIANTLVEELELPREIVLGAIIRGDDVILPAPETELRPHDHVIFISTREHASDVEKLFSVQVDFF